MVSGVRQSVDREGNDLAPALAFTTRSLDSVLAGMNSGVHHSTHTLQVLIDDLGIERQR